MSYYNGTKILSKKDLDGLNPEIIIVESNRTAGKTFFFTRMLLNNFIKKNKKFAIILRYKNQLDSCGEKLFKGVLENKFSGKKIVTKMDRSKIFSNIFLDNKHCGYGIAISAARQIKEISSNFIDVEEMLLDEMQPIDFKYVKNEVHNLQSIHTSIARGYGKQTRFVRLIMLSNAVSLLNPYYVQLGISQRLRKDTKIMRGHGWVLERTINESAAKAMSESRFNIAFGLNKMYQHEIENKYMDDNAFVVKMSGNFIYLCTLRYGDSFFSIKFFSKESVMYCDHNYDIDFPKKFAVDLNSFVDGDFAFDPANPFKTILRQYYYRGDVYCSNLLSKECLLNFISY